MDVGSFGPLAFPRNARPVQSRERLVQATTNVWGPAKAELLSELIGCYEQGRLPAGVLRMLTLALIPPAARVDLTGLPEQVTTPQDWLAAIEELYRLRRANLITDAEWLSLRQGMTDQYHLSTEIRALIAQQGRRD